MSDEASLFDFWREIGGAERIHPRDLPVLSRISHGFALDCLPSSFWGPLRSARVVLLFIAPGLRDLDREEAQTAAGQQRYELMRRGDQPMPDESAHLDVARWWRSRTQVFGEIANLAHNLAVLNIAPYHSKSFTDPCLLTALPSARASLHWAQTILFPQAEAGERVVICLRAARFWGLEPGRKYGEGLFAPTVTRGGHMHKNCALRDEVLRAVPALLSRTPSHF